MYAVPENYVQKNKKHVRETHHWLEEYVRKRRENQINELNSLPNICEHDERYGNHDLAVADEQHCNNCHIWRQGEDHCMDLRKRCSAIVVCVSCCRCKQ